MMRATSVLFVWLAILLIPLSASVRAESLPQTIEKIKPSVVAVGTVQKTRVPPASFQGTGFVVGNGLYIVTNAHVLPPVLNAENKETLGIFSGSGEAAKFREAKAILVDKEHDLALLKIDGEALPALNLGDTASVREGQALAFTGFPIGPVLGLYPVTHHAFVSAITPVVIPAANFQQLDIKMIKRMRTTFSVFQLDATAYPGNSGSPLYDTETGAVQGIVNMVFIKGTKERALSEPSGITYAIPGKYIRELLNSAGVK